MNTIAKVRSGGNPRQAQAGEKLRAPDAGDGEPAAAVTEGDLAELTPTQARRVRMLLGGASRGDVARAEGRSTGSVTKTIADAARRLPRLPAAIAAARAAATGGPPPADPLTAPCRFSEEGWAGLVGDYIGELAVTCCRAYVIRARRTLGRFLAQAALGHPSQLTAAVVSGHLAGLRAAGRAASTIGNELTLVSGFCGFLVGRGFLEANPCRQVRRPKAAETLPAYLSEREIRQVLAIARRGGFGPEVALALATGLRVGELAALRWGDVDAGRRVLRVRKSKSRRPRVVPLSAAALAALRAQRRVSGELAHVFPARHTYKGGAMLVDRPRSQTVWGDLLKPLQAAIPAFRQKRPHAPGNGWHLFRSTLASRLVQAGVSIYKVAGILGHRDVNMTARKYAALAIGYDQAIELAGLDAAGGGGRKRRAS